MCFISACFAFFEFWQALTPEKAGRERDTGEDLARATAICVCVFVSVLTCLNIVEKWIDSFWIPLKAIPKRTMTLKVTHFHPFSWKDVNSQHQKTAVCFNTESHAIGHIAIRR